MTTTLLSTSQDSPLLLLPPELRNNIYHLVLTSDDGEAIEVTLSEIESRTTILRTCSQIRTEATQIFYATNHFRISNFLSQESEVDRFVKNAGASMKYIPKLTVRIPLPPLYTKMVNLLLISVINYLGEDTEKVLKEAAEHVLETAYNSIMHCAHKLLQSDIRPLKVDLEKCNFDPDDATQGPTDYVVGVTTQSVESALANVLATAMARYVERKTGIAILPNDDEDQDSDDEGKDEEGVNDDDGNLDEQSVEHEQGHDESGEGEVDGSQ